MLLLLEGVIARRFLLNYRVNPEVIRPLIPPALELVLQKGWAVAGICLIRLEKLRAKGMPEMMGLSSENMAHRVAIRFPTKEGLKDRVFIWRRDTNQRLISFLGGRLFPGVHSSADFQSMETMNGLAMNIHTKAGQADTNFEVSFKTSWNKTELFETFQEACQFFERGNCGFSCSLDGEKLEGIRLKTLKWEMEPIKVENIRSNFYEGWPAHREGKIVFDNALMMRGIPHEWHEIKDVPELAHSS